MFVLLSLSRWWRAVQHVHTLMTVEKKKKQFIYRHLSGQLSSQCKSVETKHDWNYIRYKTFRCVKMTTGKSETMELSRSVWINNHVYWYPVAARQSVWMRGLQHNAPHKECQDSSGFLATVHGRVLLSMTPYARILFFLKTWYMQYCIFSVLLHFIHNGCDDSAVFFYILLS